MSVVIQKATLDDLVDIQNLNNKLFELEIAEFDPDLIHGWPLTDAGADYFRDMIENHFVLVAKDEKTTIGYFAGTIGLKEFYTDGNLAEMDNMFISESYRGNGIGEMFFESFLKECKAENITDIRATASAKNLKAIHAYEKWGFHPKNITLNYKV